MTNVIFESHLHNIHLELNPIFRPVMHSDRTGQWLKGLKNCTQVIFLTFNKVDSKLLIMTCYQSHSILAYILSHPATLFSFVYVAFVLITTSSERLFFKTVLDLPFKFSLNLIKTYQKSAISGSQKIT